MTVINKFLKSAVIGIISATIGITAVAENSTAQGLFSTIFSGIGSDRPPSRTIVKLKTPYRTGSIVVSIGDRRLYKILPGEKAISYPIAIPDKGAFWSGVEPVTRKAVNPRWTPTASMRKENPDLPPFVKGGDPRNPLGVRALYLGSTLYRIHGTDAPQLIGKSVSRGCIRMYNQDVVDLYDRTTVGTKVIVTGKTLLASAAVTVNTEFGPDVFTSLN